MGTISNFLYDLCWIFYYFCIWLESFDLRQYNMNKKFTLPKDGGLIEEGLPYGLLHSYERIPVELYDDSLDACEKIAEIIVEAISKKPQGFRLGLTTGKSPLSLYDILSEKCSKGEVSFKGVEIFSTDEYLPIDPDAPQSRRRRLKEELIDRIDILPENFHVPGEDVAAYDLLASDLDLLVIGVGEYGQLAFNEAGSNEASRTRTVAMSAKTRKFQARNFNGNIADTPRAAVTMGIGTMKSAKKIILMAWGERKCAAVKQICEEPASISCPASLLQGHRDISLFVDENASSSLTRVVAPWLVGPCDWTPKFIRKAVVWLCGKVHKPILKLSHQDYIENSLGDLLELKGPYDKINIDVFNDLQHTITGWPGGKPNADDSTRPVASTPFPKRVIVFSPHPDDDVISMGGTFIRLVEQGHDVHVAYETSGNVAVHDDVVYQHIDAARELGYGDRREEVRKIIDSKVPGEPEPRALLDIKAAIRRSEARGAVRSFGLNEDTNAHFLNLPFYETGGIKKGARTQRDIDIIKDLLQKVQPHQIFVAGDLADPHGTHRVCTEAVLEALSQLRDEAWMQTCHCWLYRGAWMEWELGKVDMAVPLSPDELIKKRHAIYRHLSQKDIMPFPGDDPREFWQRAEERTQNTARLYDELGMAEYQAIEVFVKLF